MLKSGNEHLESLRDGRVVYIGAERVDDVTTHPAFRNAARSMAAIYDLKRADPAFSFAEGGDRYSAYFPRAPARICSSEPRFIAPSPRRATGCSAARPTTSRASSRAWR